MSSTARIAARNQAVAPRVSQAQLDMLLDAHERFVRREPRARRAVIRFLQAPGLTMNKRILIDADFTGANFQHARLILADLTRASLYAADLRAADARCANFTRADIRGVSLRGANLSGANLDEADLREAVLARSDADLGFRIVGRSDAIGGGGEAPVYAVDFSNCSMKKARLANAKLKGANFSGAVLHGADFKGANLSGCRFDGAVLTGVKVEELRADPGALFSCVLDPTPKALQRVAQLMDVLAAAERWVLTNGADGSPAVLDGEDLRPLGKVFEKRRLTAMSASGVCAIGVSFAGAQLQGAVFDGADLRDADFTGADLRGASFRDANLWHARFEGADTRPLALARGGFQDLDLDGARHAPDAFRAARAA